MLDPPVYLLSTLLDLPDGHRAAIERELTEHARRAVLGDLAADVAHDIANPLFAIIGLVELLLGDAEPGSQEEERLLLIRQTGLDLKGSLSDLVDLARTEPDAEPRADLAEAARKAMRIARRGRGKETEFSETYPDEPVVVACPEALVVQAALHLLVGARGNARAAVEVSADGALRVAPSKPDALGTMAVRRIAADHGGSFENSSFTLPLVR
jgi:signal transduction histidine kinase